MPGWILGFRTASVRAHGVVGLSLCLAAGCGDATAELAEKGHASPHPALIAQAVLASGTTTAVGATSATDPSAQTARGQAASASSPALPPPRKSVAPSFPVRTTRVVLEVDAGRRLPIQLWYPAVEAARAAAAAGRPVLDFEPDEPQRSQWAGLIRNATPYYTQRTMHAAEAPEAAATPALFPLVLVSHCNECTRFSYFTVAEKLAAHGFVVAAPDHLDNTLYDAANGTSVGLEMNDFLERRRLDIFRLTDALLDANAEVIPSSLRGRIDKDRIGMLGHSFGAITTSYASTRDPRIRAIGILAMIASLDDRLPYTGEQLAMRVMLEPLGKPALFVIAAEDAIDLFGMNDIIRSNFTNYPGSAVLATLADTGHYSVTNICGINDAYTNGCGPGVRLKSFLEPFTYLNIDFATDLTAQLVTTFFEEQLLGGSAGTFAAIEAGASSVLKVETHAAPQ